jgi:hypothetical protein
VMSILANINDTKKLSHRCNITTTHSPHPPAHKSMYIQNPP